MQEGTLLVGRFEIGALAGSGAMGEIYRSHDRVTRETVAVKVLSGGDVDRFLREAELLAGLRHPRIVRHVAHGVTAEGAPYLAMEWLEGETLAERLSRELLLPVECLDLLVSLADAIAVAHHAGIVHRDLKPSNLFLPEGRLDRVKILDFGIARALGGRGLTVTGAILGTPRYMAPEQARGERSVDARADVFALGCVAFKCLTGRTPFEGDDILAVLLKLVMDDAPRLRDINCQLPLPLDDMIARMLAKAPEDRFADGSAVLARAAAVRHEVDRAEQVSPAAAHPVPPPARMVSEQRVTCFILVPSARRSLRGGETLPLFGPDPRDEGLRAAVTLHRGSLEELPDGSALVLFAATEAATDNAAQAARCALSLLDCTAGPVAIIAGRSATARLPLGDSIDRAVKLVSESSAIGVYVDEVIAGLLGTRFDVRAAAGVFVLHGELEPMETARKLLGKPTKCVGREREIASIQSILDEVVEDSVARAMLVTAPAGAGKSRLRHELIGRIRQFSTPVEVWLGAGDPVHAGSPFGLLAQILRRAVGIADGEPLAVRREKLRARVSGRMPGQDVEAILEFLGELAGVPVADGASVALSAARSDPILMGDHMRRAWEDFLRAECTASPVLLVIEDLHWGDLPTVRFVGAALRHLEDKPFMALAFARPEVSERFPKLWDGRVKQHLHLGPLPAKESARLARDVLGPGLPDEAITELVKRSEGNGFYLEELIRSVAEGKGGSFPATVLAMAEARLQRLGPEARRLLRTASILGTTFWSGAVDAVLGPQPGADAESWLSDLVDKEVVMRNDPSRFPGEREYLFRHALLRDAAYATLTETDREMGHRLVGRWLEEKGETDGRVLAEHFEQGAEPSDAARWYHRAATSALEGNDFEAAIAAAEGGFRCTTRSLRGVGSSPSQEPFGPNNHRAHFRLLQAEAHRWRGEPLYAGKRALEALAALEVGSSSWYAAAREAILAAGRGGLFDEVQRVMDAVHAAVPRAGAEGRRIVTLSCAASLLLARGQYEQGARLLRDMESDSAIASWDPIVRAQVHDVRARVANILGNVGEYLYETEQSLACFDQVGSVRSACNKRVSLGYGYHRLGDHDAAERVLRQALAEADRMGLPNIRAAAKQNLGAALAAQGNLVEALKAEGESIDELAKLGDRRMEGASRIYLSMMLVQMEDPAATEEARIAVEVLADNPPLRAQALAIYAMACLQRGGVSEALRLAKEAFDLLAALGGLEDGESPVRLAYAEALHAAGHVADARLTIGDARERLLKRAAGIHDAELRASFLQRVPENARTLSLADGWHANVCKNGDVA